ncbi:hypothetical protein [Xanthobacter autotrophicus]|uniref:hypothetical protein n=1 Tax=Xanthobacter autotrophicus TaxID=280 RepID=UPI0024A77AC1|nr:hypothetical protein [Xanthobacter autotrophicus]MDI4655544.1 hypothetical protein [Xanthobacter autotrophicus]
MFSFLNREDDSPIESRSGAFSSEVDTGSRKENASIQDSRAIAVSQGEGKMLWSMFGKHRFAGHALNLCFIAIPDPNRFALLLELL